MENFSITCLRYTVQAETIIRFGALSGAQLRGGLFNELRQMAHTNWREVNDPQHQATCPVCRMMARENQEAARGRDVPRPFGILPPLASEYQPGECFSFGLHLYGDTLLNYPLMTLAVNRLGQTGVGYGRGQFRLHRIENINPLTGDSIMLLSHGKTGQPTLHLDSGGVHHYASLLSPDHLMLRFLTPLRLIDQGKLVHEIQFRPLIARLLERLEALESEYAGGERWETRYQQLTELANRIEVVRDATRWLDVHSGSRRQNEWVPIGGLVGDVTFNGNLHPFHEWLIWGSLTQVGKNIVKGGGWYEIVAQSGKETESSTRER